ncbi:MAG: 50S ribosomal protein L15e [Candidatus Diapherotrites archaeon]|uniref:50S ribosomal protein L15e n=1 Tax=Candidatus Iainarchaeum sp. TaxID=3101447 RepID=A0A8T4LHG5_9ARCH|nr:50S ribosomal protein L15e [Candidatus Diapherotrites archaeon]
MSLAQHVKETFQKEFKGVQLDESYDYKKLNRERLISFRRPVEAIVRLDKPTNIPRARELGYKAKQGVFAARVRIRKGGGLHFRPKRGRKPKRMGIEKLTRKQSIQGIAEQRAGKRFPNCEVLNSYYIGEDGQHFYFEAILVDPFAPTVKADKELNWVCAKQHKDRAERGLTSAQKRSRGLHGKGIGYEKNRPSLRAHHRQGN